MFMSLEPDAWILASSLGREIEKNLIRGNCYSATASYVLP